MIFRGETRGEIVTRPDVSLSDRAAARISATLRLFLRLMSTSGLSVVPTIKDYVESSYP